QEAFEPYYGETVAPPSDPNLLYDTRHALDEFGVLRPDEIEKVAALLVAVSGPSDHGRIHAALAPAIDRVNDLEEEERDRFIDALSRFVRTYGFLSQIVSFGDTELERDYLFCRALSSFIPKDDAGSVDLGSDIELTHLRHEKQFEGSVSLDSDTGEVQTIFAGTGATNEPEPETLSTIIERFNDRFGTDWSDSDRLFPDQIEEDLVNNDQIQLEAGANDLDAFSVGFDDTYLGAIASRLDRNDKVAAQLLDDEDLRAALLAEYRPRIYARARVARQRTCSIGDLLGEDREDLHLEYKSTLRWDIKAESKKTGIPEKAVVKTVAGFLNSEYGGTLLVGVADDGSVYGLEKDYETFSKRGQRGDHDLFGQHLQNLLVGRLGASAASIVGWEFHTIDGNDICRVSVEPADHPVYEGTGDDDRTFWWRYPTGTTAVTDETEQNHIIRRRFGVGG
ncbi:MAG: ATP-binding protein, partial [Desulfobulbaceae bacterium]|nr:ATP-binding protein [Desulfobulbaceae bacterium]